MSLRVGTYNIESGWADYISMVYAKPVGPGELKGRLQDAYPKEVWDLLHQQERSKQEKERIQATEQAVKQSLMEAVEERVALRIADVLDVICLQEVGTMTRPVVKTLRQLGFAIYPGKHLVEEAQEIFSTAIALRTDRFTSAHNISLLTKNREKALYGQEIAAIVGQLSDSSITVAIASLHSWSFTLYHPLSTEERVYSLEDRERQAASERYVKIAMDLLQKQGADLSLMAGDMNNNPENYPVVFEQIKAGGYAVFPSYESTCLNRFEVSYPLRVVDFIFPKGKKTSRESLCTRASSSKNHLKITWTQPHVLEGFQWTPDDNCSNHKPVGMVITFSHDLGPSSGPNNSSVSQALGKK